MALTKYDVIKDRLRSSYLKYEKAYLYQQMIYQLGQESVYSGSHTDSEGRDLWGDGFLYHKNIEIHEIIKGHSRKPLNTTYIMQSRVMGDMPEPLFPQLDPFSAEVRKQYCLNRPLQNYGFGEWFPNLTACFNDADGLGYAGVQVGQQVDPLDGNSTVITQNISPLNILWDPLVPHPSQSTWMAVIHYMTPDDVQDLYGGKKNDIIAKAQKPAFETISSYKWDVVRVMEYWDLGTGKGEPTYSVIVGALDKAKGEHDSFVMHEFNAREEIPIALMVNFVAPGMSRPVGRVHLQMQSSKMINLLESYMFRILAGLPEIDIVYLQDINQDDWRDIQNGTGSGMVRSNKPLDKKMWERIPKKGLDNVFLTMLEYYGRQYTEDSGLSELDRGVSPDKVRSAREIGTIDARSQQNQAWIPREAARFTARFYQRVVSAARFEDDKPILIDYHGKNIPLNQDIEEFPNLTVSAFMEEFSFILIDQMALTAGDDEQKRQARLLYLERIRAVGIPVDEQWFAEEYLRAGGKDDAKIALGQGNAATAAVGINPAALQAGTTGQAATQPLGT